MSNDLLSKGLSLVRGWFEPPPEKVLERIRDELRECADLIGGEVSARQRAAKLAKTYAELDENGRRAFLRILLTEFGPEPERIDAAYDAYRAARGSDEQWQAEAALRESLRSPRSRILTQFSASDAGVHFLVDLRAELLDFLRDDPLLAALDLELQGLLASWFDVALLELQRITWHSPADVLERLMQYEAVHEIESWQDLKNRLDSDRRCYAFFHPRMPSVPLIFVEVALTEGLAGDVQQLLDVSAPLFATERADTAIFYSISNTQKGLRGISFGHFLLKRVIDDLRRDFPKLERFATLSPIPGLVRWYRAHPEALADVFTASDWRKLRTAGAPDGTELLQRLLETPEIAGTEAWREALAAPLLRAAARYLLATENGRALDPVARFHLGNGARIERLNWLADTSPKGWRQSWAIMVNYRYEPDKLQDRIDAYERDGLIEATSAVRRLAR